MTTDPTPVGGTPLDPTSGDRRLSASDRVRVSGFGGELDAARRSAIIRLLETRDDHLPEPRRRDLPTRPGFVHVRRPRTCPDCLANGRVLKGCETCGGSGVVSPARMGLIAAPDALVDDEQARDPYAVEKVQPYGLDPARHDRGYAISSSIEAARRELRRFPGFRPQGVADEIADADLHPFGWERARRVMYERFDYAALDVALDELAAAYPRACHALHAVFVYRYLPAADCLVVEFGLVFLSARLPERLRAPRAGPGLRVGAGPLRPEAGSRAKRERDRAMRAAAAEGATVPDLMGRFGVSKATVYAVVNGDAE